ncbi:MAG TPA: hypothetical protein VHZ03_24465 [Trebonia sp.]|nr:hypothetical protein [Trebonia sp.]
MNAVGWRVGLEETAGPDPVPLRAGQRADRRAEPAVPRKNPGRLIYPLVQPLVMLVMFVSVFGKLPFVTAAAIVAAAVAFGLAFAVLSAWLGLLVGDPETAERVLFFPAIAVAFVSSAFAPVGLLACWMQPIARVNPVSAACAVIRSLASGGSLRFPLLVLGCWVLGLFLVPGVLAVRRWQAPR